MIVQNVSCLGLVFTIYGFLEKPVNSAVWWNMIVVQSQLLQESCLGLESPLQLMLIGSPLDVQ